jgi:hypothetical protein
MINDKMKKTATRSNVLQLANVVTDGENVVLSCSENEKEVELSVTGAYGSTLSLLFDSLVLLFGYSVIEGDFGDTYVYTIKKG